MKGMKVEAVTYDPGNQERISECQSCGRLERARVLKFWSVEDQAACLSPSCNKCGSSAITWKQTPEEIQIEEVERAVAGIGRQLQPLLRAAKDLFFRNNKVFNGDN